MDSEKELEEVDIFLRFTFLCQIFPFLLQRYSRIVSNGDWLSVKYTWCDKKDCNKKPDSRRIDGVLLGKDGKELPKFAKVGWTSNSD